MEKKKKKNLPAKAGNTGWIPVWEDPTCRGVTTARSHNQWVCSQGSQLQQQSLGALETMLHNQRRGGNESAHEEQKRSPAPATRERLSVAMKTQSSWK